MPTDTLRSWHETEFRASSDPNRVTAVISTESLARDGAIIRADGWELGEFRKNPVVLWGHSDGPGGGLMGGGGATNGMPIARGENVRIEGKKLLADAVFDEDDPVAMQVKRKIDNRFIHTTSVRWKPIKSTVRSMEVDGQKRDVLVFERQTLLEFSFVSVPADPGATIVRAATGEAIDVTAIVAEAERIAAEELPEITDEEWVENVGVTVSSDTTHSTPEQIAAERAAIASHSTAVDKGASWDGPKAVASAPNDRRVLRHMHAIFRGGDPDVKGNYALPHHAPRAGSAANLRGVNNAKARLPQTQGIDSATRRGAEQHLNRHQRDAGEGEEQANLSPVEDSAWEAIYQLDHAGVVTPDEQMALRSLHSAIGRALDIDTVEQVAELERQVRALVDVLKAEPSPQDVVIDALARMTGRSPERIRKEIAHG